MKKLSLSKRLFFWFANAFVPRLLFRGFFEDDRLFQKYLNHPDLKSKLMGNAQARTFLLKHLIEELQKNNSHANLHLLHEFILMLEPNEKNKTALIMELRRQIKDNFRGRQFHVFEEFLRRIVPLDRIYGEYFKMYARQMLKADVGLDEWKNLLEKSKSDNSNIQRNIISQLITKLLHTEDLEKSIELFKEMIRKYEVATYDLRLIIGIFKLAIKQKKFTVARNFRRYVFRMRWPFGFRYFARLKLVEVMAELESADKHRDYENGDLWKGMFLKLKKFRTTPENKSYIRELERIYRELGLKHDLLLDIRISSQEQKILFDLILKKLQKQEPLLLLRVGDADSYGLQTSKIDPATMEKDCAAREMKWWGQHIPDELKDKIRRQFQETILNSDVIGIPSVFRFVSDIPTPDTSFFAARNQRGSVAVMNSIHGLSANDRLLKTMIFTENRCHHSLFNQGALAGLLSEAHHVLIVSRHNDEKIRAVFAKWNIETLQIPDEGSKKESLPFKIDGLVESLRAKVKKGSLVLVSAGFAGKYFLKVAKDKGAVALDVGAMADYWVGVKSRGVSELI